MSLKGYWLRDTQKFSWHSFLEPALNPLCCRPGFPLLLGTLCETKNYLMSKVCSIFFLAS